MQVVSVSVCNVCEWGADVQVVSVSVCNRRRIVFLQVW